MNRLKTKILLIGFYNEKALGVQYLANSLNKNNYDCYLVFFKEFNSVNPSKASDKELDLLEDIINEVNPLYIGLSVMSSLYLETIYMINNKLRDKFDIPIIWGGVYPSLFPDRALKHCDFVLRGESEYSLVKLLDRLTRKEDTSTLENLVFIDKAGSVVVNDVRMLEQNIDNLGFPDMNYDQKYFICNDTVTKGNFNINNYTYELTASRGCPFACSYCNSININRLYHKKGRYVRFRSVESVLKELRIAKKTMKNLKVIHFWDEIFSDEEGWVEEFKEKYKKEIGLPFKIWGHPLKVSERVIKNLTEAGLYQVVMGIQSGSVRVRKEVFNRPETQEQIIEASKILSKSKVPKVIYDFMLCHPFETVEDLKETFKLCQKLAPRFELQLHGLNFLPGTDIVKKAIDEGILSEVELEKIMNSTIKEQYDMHWGPAV